MSKKLFDVKKGENFSFGLFIVFSAMAISLLAFISEENKITGLAALEDTQRAIHIIKPILIEFNDVDSLKSLAPGNYHIDEDGIVSWLDDDSNPIIAKVNFVEEAQKNRHIYIADSGRIGYVLSEISISEQQ